MKLYLFVIAILYLYSCNAQKSQEFTNWQKLDSLVEKHIKEKYIPAISIGVVKDGEILFVKGYGYADPDKKKPANEKTVYQLGSVTKTITGHLLAMLISEGEIKLNDTLANFFPANINFPKYINGNPITIKDLATHSAEFPRYPANLQRVDPEPIKGYSYEEMLAGIEETFIDSIGGRRFNYSNFGYGILSMAIQNHTEQDFSQLLDEKIFEPYKMEYSSLYLTDKNRNQLAVPFLEVNPAVKTEPWDMGTMAGAGNVFTNVEDMSKFLLAMMEENEVNEIQQSRLLQINKNNYYGLGCFIIDSKKVNTTLIYHGGDVDGYSSSLKYYPEYDLGTVVLTNYGEGAVIGDVFMDIEVFILDFLRDKE